MRQPTLIFCIIGIGVLSIAELVSLSTTVAPHSASNSELWAFFISLFGTCTCILFGLWYIIKKSIAFKGPQPKIFITLRQASLFSLVIVLSLFFNSLHILSIWDIVPLLVSAVLIEFFFQAEKSIDTHE
jgi:hypothetical protein